MIDEYEEVVFKLIIVSLARDDIAVCKESGELKFKFAVNYFISKDYQPYNIVHGITRNLTQVTKNDERDDKTSWKR